MSNQDIRRGVVRNPLTVIAIFAGLAEVTATIALPNLADDVQNIFVWFVMIFPVSLVVLFFLTLWLKHQVLYAPSDYRDEQNFMSYFAPPTPNQILREVDTLSRDLLNSIDALEANGDSQVSAALPISEDSGRERFVESRLAESLAISRIASKLGVKFSREMQLLGMRDVRYDAIADSVDGPVLLEVKMVRGASMMFYFARRELERAAILTYKIPPSQLGRARLIIVFVYPDHIDRDEIQRGRARVLSLLSDSNLPINIQCEFFSLGDLKQEMDE